MPFTLTILGSSSAIPTSERYPTAQVLEVPGRYFLIDCGEGTQIQIRRHKVKFSKIQHIFISHLHGDHYYGLIGFISTLNLLGIKNDIHIYAPSELRELIQPQLQFLKGEMGFKVIFHPLNFKRPQKIYADKKVEVFSFPVKHTISACGFLFKEIQKQANIKKECIAQYNIPIAQIKEIKAGADFVTAAGEIIPNANLTIPPPKPHSYAFSTDTIFRPSNAKIFQNVDLLYHEATFLDDMKDWARKTGHSTAAEAAKMAQLANAKKLIIGHFSSRYKDITPLVEEARTIFENTEAAEDGNSYNIG